jgi:hypothetical protein
MSTSGWIGVDLDGTLAQYDGWRGEDHIGDPIPKMIDRVKGWLAEGIEVRIVTARCFSPQMIENGFHVATMSKGEVLKCIRQWCAKHIGQELPIQCWKDYGMIELWDDRAVQVNANTGERADGGA